MAKYNKSFKDLIEDEDRLITILEKNADEIVNQLYITEESSDKNRVQEAEARIESLREREKLAKSELKEVRTSMIRYLLRIMERLKYDDATNG